MKAGKLYLIPTTMGESAINDVLPLLVTRTTETLFDFIAENEKTARKFIKQITPDKVQNDLRFGILNKRTTEQEYSELIKPLLEGKNMGLMSEAGCPGVADPGAAIVQICHEKNIQVVPLVGPSSILLALMASGMNGQSFAFNGYLPIDKTEKKKAIKDYERLSLDKDQSQLFIETPYRNNKLVEDFLQNLAGNTLLCIACDITLDTEYIKTKTVKEWKKEKVDLQNRPTLFILHKKY